MPSINAQRWQAHRDIDRVAGEVRLRYITDVPGQQAVYITKLQEAEAYAAAHALDSQAPVPPYLAAESAAMGDDAIDTAQMVLGLAAQWNGVLGPAIEAARVAGKAAVTAATTEQGIATARAAAIAALDVL
jgi:hypothetical protein